ncbi:MAG: 30S ribosomal protein S6 [Deltaproteobacteria bacterium]|nr:30S ribosomal protein S6 [Deltaproteobacteria bacterium]
MRIYETMLVLDPEMSKEQIGGFVEKLKQFLGDRGATVIKVAEWGLNTLACKIKKKKKGYYILLYLNGDAAIVAEMERSLRLMEEVLRYLTVKREEADIEASQQSAAPGQEGGPVQERKTEEETAMDKESTGPEGKE